MPKKQKQKDKKKHPFKKKNLIHFFKPNPLLAYPLFFKIIIFTLRIFTASAHRADSALESRYPSVCLYVCDVLKHPLPEVVETSGHRCFGGRSLKAAGLVTLTAYIAAEKW